MNNNASCKVKNNTPLTKNIFAGAIGGIFGGIVFGMMMYQMGMLPMIAMMMGSESAIVGFMVHMMISVLFGAMGGLLLNLMPSCPGQMLMFSFIFGALLWVIGPLLVMPIMMNTPLFTVNDATMMSLMGHTIYAIITLVIGRMVANRL